MTKRIQIKRTARPSRPQDDIDRRTPSGRQLPY